jgi:hypothetical protein
MLILDFSFSWLLRGGLSLKYFYGGYTLNNGDSHSQITSDVDQAV